MTKSADKLPPSIDVPAKSSGFDVREIGRAVIYCREGHRELAPHLADFVRQALELAPTDSRLGYIDADGEWSAEQTHEALIAYVSSISEGTFMLGDLERPQHFVVEYHGSEPGAPEEQASWLAVVIPRARLYLFDDEPEEPDEDGPLDVGAWFTKLVATLPFSSATLGLALVGNGQKMLPLQRRYLALDVAIPSSIKTDLGERVAGVGWRTALGSYAITELGGIDHVASVLGDRVTIEPAGEGAVLRLGRAPTRGEAKDDLSAYEAVATMLEAEDLLHVPRKVLYMSYDGAYGQDFRQRAVAAQNAWHLRFVKAKPRA